MLVDELNACFVELSLLGEDAISRVQPAVDPDKGAGTEAEGGIRMQKKLQANVREDSSAYCRRIRVADGNVLTAQEDIKYCRTSIFQKAIRRIKGH